MTDPYANIGLKQNVYSGNDVSIFMFDEFNGEELGFLGFSNDVDEYGRRLNRRGNKYTGMDSDCNDCDNQTENSVKTTKSDIKRLYGEDARLYFEVYHSPNKAYHASKGEEHKWKTSQHLDFLRHHHPPAILRFVHGNPLETLNSSNFNDPLMYMKPVQIYTGSGYSEKTSTLLTRCHSEGYHDVLRFYSEDDFIPVYGHSTQAQKLDTFWVLVPLAGPLINSTHDKYVQTNERFKIGVYSPHLINFTGIKYLKWNDKEGVFDLTGFSQGTSFMIPTIDKTTSTWPTEPHPSQKYKIDEQTNTHLFQTSSVGMPIKHVHSPRRVSTHVHKDGNVHHHYHEHDHDHGYGYRNSWSVYPNPAYWDEIWNQHRVINTLYPELTNPWFANPYYQGRDVNVFLSTDEKSKNPSSPTPIASTPMAGSVATPIYQPMSTPMMAPVAVSPVATGNVPDVQKIIEFISKLLIWIAIAFVVVILGIFFWNLIFGGKKELRIHAPWESKEYHYSNGNGYRHANGSNGNGYGYGHANGNGFNSYNFNGSGYDDDVFNMFRS